LPELAAVGAAVSGVEQLVPERASAASKTRKKQLNTFMARLSKLILFLAEAYL
jgi:hypothetical protein